MVAIYQQPLSRDPSGIRGIIACPGFRGPSAMHPVIRFKTTLFDLAAEKPNPINPIRGSSILEWLRARPPEDMEMSDSAAEDWGWYCDVTWPGATYLLGASAEEAGDGNHEWALQLEKSRSLVDKLLGRNKLAEDDFCLATLREVLSQEPAFTEVTVELGP
jgi:hypothetical protein